MSKLSSPSSWGAAAFLSQFVRSTTAGQSVTSALTDLEELAGEVPISTGITGVPSGQN
jgi:hypothetical protein